jgi:superfamily I DNA and/or RNA helicase
LISGDLLILGDFFKIWRQIEMEHSGLISQDLIKISSPQNSAVKRLVRSFVKSYPNTEQYSKRDLLRIFNKFQKSIENPCAEVKDIIFLFETSYSTYQRAMASDSEVVPIPNSQKTFHT